MRPVGVIGVIFDFTLFLTSLFFWPVYLDVYEFYFLFFSKASSYLCSHHRYAFLGFCYLSSCLWQLFFPRPDLTRQKGPLKHYSWTSLPGLFLWFLFVLTPLVYLHRFPCLCKPCSPLRVQFDNFFGSCAGLRQFLLPATRACLFDMPAGLLAQLFCSAVW